MPTIPSVTPAPPFRHSCAGRNHAARPAAPPSPSPSTPRTPPPDHISAPPHSHRSAPPPSFPHPSIAPASPSRHSLHPSIIPAPSPSLLSPLHHSRAPSRHSFHPLSVIPAPPSVIPAQAGTTRRAQPPLPRPEQSRTNLNKSEHHRRPDQIGAPPKTAPEQDSLNTRTTPNKAEQTRTNPNNPERPDQIGAPPKTAPERDSLNTLNTPNRAEQS